MLETLERAMTKLGRAHSSRFTLNWTASVPAQPVSKVELSSQCACLQQWFLSYITQSFDADWDYGGGARSTTVNDGPGGPLRLGEAGIASFLWQFAPLP